MSLNTKFMDSNYTLRTHLKHSFIYKVSYSSMQSSHQKWLMTDTLTALGLGLSRPTIADTLLFTRLLAHLLTQPSFVLTHSVFM